ncbi:hypothetical protein FHS16_005646 [Paenibacillus endophyticus]|uniref:Uncharacterized protein n=1 Tax=Paenibacillus endophyticus TaxID=1294268 RepID=A0A7W5CD58_9BACL|nr:hypothetical protein [Paenibacillus endophyticus]
MGTDIHIFLNKKCIAAAFMKLTELENGYQ